MFDQPSLLIREKQYAWTVVRLSDPLTHS